MSLGLKLYGDQDVVLNRLPVAVTLGNFDGVHFGHKKVIEELKALAGGVKTLVITFFPHPTQILCPTSPKPLLYGIDDRVRLLLEAGVDCVAVQEFSRDFSSLSADEFCSQYLRKNFNIQSILLGFNFLYGRDRLGNFEHLKKYSEAAGWICKLGNAHTVNEDLVSSSLIREFISKGNVAAAANALTRPYALKGTVIKGDQRGRLLGFPTANLRTDAEVLPSAGVYACRVILAKQKKNYFGVMNCGFRPTIANDLRWQIETHILDFNEDIYGEEIEFVLEKFLRGEKKFSGLEELKAQIAADVKSARCYFKI